MIFIIGDQGQDLNLGPGNWNDFTTRAYEYTQISQAKLFGFPYFQRRFRQEG